MYCNDKSFEGVVEVSNCSVHYKEVNVHIYLNVLKT